MGRAEGVPEDHVGVHEVAFLLDPLPDPVTGMLVGVVTGRVELPVVVSSAEQHGGQEATILSLNNVFYHWGCVIVPLGYTDDIVYAAGGNPYGTSWPAGFPSTMPDETTLDCARYQGRRLAHFAEVLAAARAEPAATSA